MAFGGIDMGTWQKLRDSSPRSVSPSFDLLSGRVNCWLCSDRTPGVTGLAYFLRYEISPRSRIFVREGLHFVHSRCCWSRSWVHGLPGHTEGCSMLRILRRARWPARWGKTYHTQGLDFDAHSRGYKWSLNYSSAEWTPDVRCRVQILVWARKNRTTHNPFCLVQLFPGFPWMEIHD